MDEQFKKLEALRDEMLYRAQHADSEVATAGFAQAAASFAVAAELRAIALDGIQRQ